MSLSTSPFAIPVLLIGYYKLVLCVIISEKNVCELKIFNDTKVQRLSYNNAQNE